MIPGLDLQAERLSIGVTGLLELIVLPGALSPSEGQDVQTRARLHRRYQKRLQREGARTEVPLRMRLSRRGVELEVSGRADALEISEDRALLTEVKTSSFPPESPLNERPDHVLQLIFYALALRKSGDAASIRARLVYIPADPESESAPVVREIDPFAKQCVQLWESTMDRLCRRLRSYLDRRSRLLDESDGFAFPYRTPRPGQQQIMQRCLETVTNGSRLLLQAPTGSGKTAAVLAGALPPALRRGMRLFFLTSKNTQKRIVTETVRALRGSGTDVHALFLRSRESACPRRLPVCLPAGCSYAKSFGDITVAEDLVGRLLEGALITPKMVDEVALQAGVCPFELALAASRWCELIVCDCNYVFDPHVRLRRFLEEPASAQLSVALVDEAANLPDRARGYWSPQVREAWIRDVERRFGGLSEAEQVLEPWKRLFGSLGGSASLFRSDSGDVTGSVTLPELSPGWRELLQKVEEPTRSLLELARSARDIDALKPEEDPRYRLFLSRHDAGLALQWYCADPSKMLLEAQERLGAVVAFSATLSPLEHYGEQLGIPEAATLETGYPFPRENLGLWVDAAVDTRYRRRTESLPLLARRIQTMFQMAPGSYLVYFPSYAYADMAAERLRSLGLPIFSQTPNMEPAQREELFARVEREQGLALLVSGGIFAEGVEFNPGSLRGAVIVGPSLPSVSPRRRFVREWFDGRGSDGFQKAFSIPGMARAVQAAGRVVRSGGCRGTVILMGQRFAQRRMARLMPSYWFGANGIPVISPSMAEIAEFWREDNEKRAAPEGPP